MAVEVPKPRGSGEHVRAQTNLYVCGRGGEDAGSSSVGNKHEEKDLIRALIEVEKQESGGYSLGM